jgi:hypothetical protein
MKVKNTKLDIKNDRIPIPEYNFKQPSQDFLQLPFRLAVIGSTTTGKTTAIVNYLNQGNYRKVFDTIIVISPTATVDPVTEIQIEKKFNTLDPDAFYSNCDFQTIRNVVKEQQNKINKYSNYLKDLEIYKKFKQDPESLTDNECTYLYEKYKFRKPTSEFAHWPTLLIIFDDCGDDLRQKFISNFVIKSRHLFISLIFINQYYAMMPASIRNNISALILFKTQDKDVLELLYTKGGYASDLSKEEFYQMLDSLKTKFEFLFTDFNAPLNKKYRKNFNQIFTNFEKTTI